MNNGLTAFFAVIVVYAGAQATVGEMMAKRIVQFGQEIEAAPRSADGALGPVDLKSGDICSLLIHKDGWRGALERWSFPRAGMAAAELSARYRFTNEDRCSKYVYHHMMIAYPISAAPG